jgi:hypothetical protein
MEIRMGRLTRETGLSLVNYYDNNVPKSLDFYCNFLKIKKIDFYKQVKKLSEKHNKIRRPITISKKILKEEIKSNKKSIFSKNNKNFYFNELNPPNKIGDEKFDNKFEYFYGY